MRIEMHGQKKNSILLKMWV